MLTISDFSRVLSRSGTSLTLIGGQAVGWWAQRYAAVLPPDIPSAVTSRDIDFWADRGEAEDLAKRLSAKPEFPGPYDMTVLSAVIPLVVNEQKTAIELLHTVPGLDVVDPEVSAVIQAIEGSEFRVLDPVSLLTTKLHGLRNFSQGERQDLSHTRILLAVIRPFIEEAFHASVRTGLWYCERVIHCCVRQTNRAVLSQHSLDWRSAIPIAFIEHLAAKTENSSNDRRRLTNFLEQRWARLT